MPELPEVEIVKRQLEKRVVGEMIREVWWDRERMLRPSPEEFVKRVKGREVERLARKGKYLFFGLKREDWVEAHLKMSGRLLYRDKTNKTNKADDYIHIKLLFTEGSELRFSDPRTFGYLEILDKAGYKARLKKLGREPLADLALKSFREILESSGRKIKDLLMDQSKIAGIGNIYANDALWLAGIHPETPARSVVNVGRSTLCNARRLLVAIEAVLREALEKGGSSRIWYRQADGKKGKYQEFFKVYSKRGEPCPRCGTQIEYIKVGGRGTFYCPECQSK